MRLFLVFAIILFSFQGLFAQFTDDFSDGDFTNNPTWAGDASAFEVNSSKQLHLKSTGSDTAILYTASSIITNSEWSFYVKQSFNSSANNHSRIYLASDQSDLKGNLNGYFVQIGGTNDKIGIWRQDADILTEIIAGTIISTGNSTNQLFIKVICDPSGNWELFAHDQNSSAYVLEGAATDNTYSSANYFGVFCKFTSSNSTKFYFNDFYVGSIIVDIDPPVVESVEVVDANNIVVKFDEVITKLTANNAQNYVIDNGIGAVTSAFRNGQDSTMVNLSLASPLVYEQPYVLSISNIEDNEGNVAPTSTHNIVLYDIKSGDIVINEIMCDPSPPVDLPEVEYIELYNNSPKDVNLLDWTLKIGNSEKTLTSVIISANSFVLIGDEDDENELSSYGKFIGLSSFSLPNSAGRLLLKDEQGNIMHYINYSQSWYNDDAKKDGGWSMEMIDANNYCGEDNNWAASTYSHGGTPGLDNSVKANNPDTKSPQVERLSVISNNELIVFFDEATDSISAMNMLKYSVTGGIGNPDVITSSYPDYKSYNLHFATAFQEKTNYILQIDSGIMDCQANKSLKKTALDFGIPQTADSSDLLINEVLFHPRNDGSDFVEIYNNSDKIIDLKNLSLASWDDEEQNWTNVKEIAPLGFLVFPQQYYILTTDGDIVKQQYYVHESQNIVQMISMPTMSNTEGNIYLINKSLQMIDGMEYTDDMHYGLLDNPEGVSLERLSISVSALDKSNWHSAATPGRNADGFGGTPTYENSQKAGLASEGEWSRTPEIFSPDNDGLDDFLQINYKMKEPGYTAKIVVYDSKGRTVRNLSSGEILGSEGQIIWDGLNDNRQKAKVGIYIIMIEYFNLNGDVQQEKLSCVLGARL